MGRRKNTQPPREGDDAPEMDLGCEAKVEIPGWILNGETLEATRTRPVDEHAPFTEDDAWHFMERDLGETGERAERRWRLVQPFISEGRAAFIEVHSGKIPKISGKIRIFESRKEAEEELRKLSGGR